MIRFILVLVVTFYSQTGFVNEFVVATFNVSMESENYLTAEQAVDADVLRQLLTSGENSQIRNIAAIIQKIRPDVLLLNEFDYIEDPQSGVLAFIRNYLRQSQHGNEPIDYPWFFVATVNTGLPSPYDLNQDGQSTSTEDDAWGYGKYPGQYGMVVLSRFPVDTEAVRTFQHFKWKDMPNALVPLNTDGAPWYNNEAWQQLPLSSKSHWDIPVLVDGVTVHVLASHPTPPVFDGPEDRNGRRNHDEIRFWSDYINLALSSYIYDDNGRLGGLPDRTGFVILGDLNASADEGDALSQGIDSLLADPRIQSHPAPRSEGAAAHSPSNSLAAMHTAVWRMRADYVLPSTAWLELLSNGVFWPPEDHEDHFLVSSRQSSSDHRLVWARLRIRAEPDSAGPGPDN